jgi:GT2 family glycosyltransferase
MHDLAIIIVSTNEAQWLTACLSSLYEHQGPIEIDVVVVDNESTDGTRELVERRFPAARVVASENRGFSHANNRGWMTCDARYALFLNPDTEILEGTFADLVAALEERPAVGLIGVKQITSNGVLFPTIRRFPGALRALGDAIWPEHMSIRPALLGERELRMAFYEQEVRCDWTSGSFMLVRREALEGAGLLDERSFIYSEEPDLSLRMRNAGWETRHLPLMTILHHWEKAGISERMAAQDAFSRVLYARKHFSRLHRGMYLGALAVRYAVRSALGSRSGIAAQRRAANRRAFRILLGRELPPFGPPPGQAVAPRKAIEADAGTIASSGEMFVRSR